MRSVAAVIVILFAIVMTGCKQLPPAYYFESFSVKSRISSEKAVGVILFDKNGVMLADRCSSKLYSVAVAYLHDRGFSSVKVLDSREVGGVVLPDFNYFTERPAKIDGGAGSGFGPAKPEGATVAGINETYEAVARVEASMKLLDLYRNEWKLDYVIAIWNPSPYSFRGRVVNLDSKAICAEFFVDADHIGWHKHNSFTVFEQKGLAPKGMRYESITVYEKALLVFLVRFITEITGGLGSGSGDGKPEEW